ncbi:carbamoyl-phosphate synthase (glutamine-hydrolyzing) large subunit [Candidatus Woesearchaeota archaeon]|jgi:carbamoyl-phosphate synthase large subunit|nr:carbamoyl-phosphate synthase (glutamine-hydrolyzing) large subunit [Candidatus Woesearchaeota archaeon]MBT5272973.1 carbamoyl-phosphate synthase (glutamine-hydrolyzing) large subunit [Candidatus Woesearchaeota archaeon]MBT6041439.1 carbamoyl-phosphate synthase (glutamine-hydrolyzing) large subunit [Candidatus Woesearchaeota archaeon]
MSDTKRINKVLILGSGGLSIGQAGEFDYSGSQAIKALKEEGIETVLVNPNIATIQTSKGFANEVYFLPVTKKFVEKIIAKERPDGILLGFGGQTALNCGMELSSSGVLEKYGVRVLGTPIKTIITSEDKGLFAEALTKINVKTPRSITVYNLDEGIAAAKKIGFPLIIRAGFALGGLGSGFCNNEEELKTLLHQALVYSSQVLVEESLKGWKEVEYEVMRDSYDNCMTVCNMENFDPLGIHTGESIVVAPSQTLTDKEYQKLRELSIKVIKSLGVVGECNVQFALDPDSEDYRVIEVNARLSRSSALASKATGYPLAFIAAKLSLGYSLVDIPNPVTKVTKAFFEPALDYIVVKIPRWDTDKFKKVDKKIGSSMKSVGEVMAIGRKFEEALQKAIRMINPSLNGLTDIRLMFDELDYELKNPTDKRVFAIVKALELGYSVKKLFEMTKIDKWFLYKIKNIVEINNELKKDSIESITPELLKISKQHGFSDKQVAKCILQDEHFDSELKIRELRKKHSVIPVIKQIDTLAGEFPCKTNYLYLTYNGDYDDVRVDDIGMRGIIVLGGGAYSIGSSVEFDWCCVECVKTLRKEKVPSIVINYNPETVSTDYDECDRLYFDELSFERVVDIYEKETPFGVIFSMGGQIPNNLVMPLSKYGVKTLGTAPEIIDKVEDRHKFSMVLDELGVDQPEWKELTDLNEIKSFCSRVGFPILIRPSYVLSGAAMNVVYEEADLDLFLKQATLVSKDHPVVLTKFITHAKEIDVDLVALNGDVKLYAISEHVENAGVHSGDATLVTPPQKLYLETVNKIKRIIKVIVKHLNITGPANFQFLAKDNKIKIIECNLRASRSFPFVSKVYNINFIELATKAIIGNQIPKVDTNAFDLEYVGVKAPQFSFTRLRGADPMLGVEMSSTGEVACLGDNLQEAFLKALLSTGFSIPKETILLSTGDVKKKARLLDSVKQLKKKGYVLYGTGGTTDFYKMHGINVEMLHWPLDNKKPNVLDYIKNKAVDLVINIPKSNEKIELSNDYIIRRGAADFSVPLITNLECTKLFIESICNYGEDDLTVKSWNEYHETLNK